MLEKTVVYIINRKIHWQARNNSGISAHPCIILYLYKRFPDAAVYVCMVMSYMSYNTGMITAENGAMFEPRWQKLTYKYANVVFQFLLKDAIAKKVPSS